MLLLDLGCGKNKRQPDNTGPLVGLPWTGVDSRAFEGVDIVHDLTVTPWPWEDNSVDGVHCSHFVEHLTPSQRIVFVNELYRVLKPGAKAHIIVPHFASCRAYGDLTHQWPPVSEFWLLYLSKEWREVNAPHNDGYTCNFASSHGYSLHHDLHPRNIEFQQFALAYYKEAAQDLIATIIKQ